MLLLQFNCEEILPVRVRCWTLRTSLDPIALHDFIEFCAGQGNLTAECLKLRLYGLALDVIYNEDHDMMTRVGLRVMIDSISETKLAALTWWGTRCSSFVGMSRYYHQRCLANGFWGNENYEFVRDGNMMQVSLVGDRQVPRSIAVDSIRFDFISFDSISFDVTSCRLISIGTNFINLN